MNKLRLFFILLGFTLFVFIIYDNSISINKLSKVKVFIPVKNNLYNDVFLKDSNLIAKLSFRSNIFKYPLQLYNYKKQYDVLVYPIAQLDTNEINIPVSSLVSIINNIHPIENTINQIYDGSYKNRYFRFLSSIDSSSYKNKFKVYIEGKITTLPIINKNIISYSLYTESFKITAQGLDYILYYIDNFNSLTEPRLSMEITFLKKDKFLYAILTFPKNNEIINKKPKLIYLIKQ